MVTFSDLIPVIAAYSCLQVALIFAVLYLKVSRRRADLVFSVLALCLTWLVWSAFRFDQRQTFTDGLYWLRMQYASAFAAAAVFLHLAGLVAGDPLRPLTLALTYLVGVGLAGFSFHPLFLHDPEAGASLDHMVPYCIGLLYPLLASVMVLVPLAAWVRVMGSFRRQREGAFAPLAHLPLILVGGLLIILAGIAIVTLVIFFPSVRIPVNIQSLAVVIFCCLIALALGREILRSERERRRLAELAEFRNQAVRDVAHEIKNPLAAIQTAMFTALEALQRDMESSLLRQFMQMSLDTCRRLNRLINNMLDTARLEAGREVELRTGRTDLAELVEVVLAAQRVISTVHRFHAEIELSDPVVCADGDKLHQILTNLVGNAVKYSPNGGRVEVRVWEQGNEVRLSVSDQGIGMTPEQQERLFRAFERMVDPGRKITGTGIGLHLVKRLVEAHGGCIWAESIYGQGSRFIVSLPVQTVLRTED